MREIEKQSKTALGPIRAKFQREARDGILNYKVFPLVSTLLITQRGVVCFIQSSLGRVCPVYSAEVKVFTLTKFFCALLCDHSSQTAARRHLLDLRRC